MLAMAVIGAVAAPVLLSRYLPPRWEQARKLNGDVVEAVDPPL
jgi:hypothetical protein